jgi:50S ribosomal subunit-associated GTPase HflX
VLVSALTGEGIEALRTAIDARFGGKDEVLVLEIPASEAGCLSLAPRQRRGARAGNAESGTVTTRFRIDPGSGASSTASSSAPGWREGGQTSRMTLLRSQR